MSEELVRTLQGRITELQAELAKSNGEARDRRTKGSDLRKEFDKLKQDHASLLSDRDGWKDKAEKSNPELTSQVAELQGKLRAVTHKAAFREAAGAARVNPKALEAAWKLSGYEPAGDEADPLAIEAALARAREDHPYLFEPAAELAEPTAERPAKLLLPTGAGGGKGSEAGPGLFRVKNADLGDPEYMEKNSAKIAEHRKAGTLAFVD